MHKDDAIQNWQEMPYLLHPDLPMEKNKSTLCFCLFFYYNRTLRNDLMSVTNYQSMIALTAGTSHFLQLCCKFHHVLHQREINRGMRPLILSNVHMATEDVSSWRILLINKLTGFRYHRGMMRALQQILTKVKCNSSKF